VIYVLFSLLGYCVFALHFVTNWRTADVEDAMFLREFWALSCMASIRRSDLSLLVSHSTSVRNFGRKFITEAVSPIQLRDNTAKGDQNIFSS
jgi:hypothetical protein